MVVLVWLCAFGIYAWLTPPVSGLGDGPEFTTALATAGLPHPTGYPLYILAGHLFARTLHVFGLGWPAAANLWSGAGAALAVALFFRLARDAAAADLPQAEAGRPWTVALAAGLPTLVLALHPLLLAEAVEAEVNTWSLAWTLGTATLFLRGTLRLEVGKSEIPVRHAVSWGLLCGAGLAHHLVSVLVSIPLSIGLGAALAARGRLRPALVLGAVLGALAPLLAYGFVSWRAHYPVAGQWPDIAPTAESVLRHVTGDRYRMYLGFFAPDPESRRVLLTRVYPILVPGLVCLGVDAVRAASRERRIVWTSWFVSAFAVFLFTLHYGVPDPAPYLLPPLALGLLGCAPVLARAASARRVAAAPAGPALLALALAVPLVWGSVSDARERREDATRFDAEVRHLWALVPGDSAIVLWPADQVTRLVEYQVLRGEKRSVWATTPEQLLDPAVRRVIERRHGVDPVGELEIPYAPRGAPWGESVRREFVARVVDRLNQRIRVPIYWFDPTGSGLTLLPKRRA